MSSSFKPSTVVTRILFNQDVPHRLTDTERAGLLAECPQAEIIETYGNASPAKPDLHDATILITDLQVPPDLGACPKLQWIQLISAGANQIVDHPISKTNIPVTTASGLHGVPIAQFVTGALLMLVHHFPELAGIQATRRWPTRRWPLRGALLWGATAGILGYGSIGRECARQLHALGMRIVALDPAAKRDEGYNVWPGTGDPEGKLPERWFLPAEVQDMLPLCDGDRCRRPSHSPDDRNDRTGGTRSGEARSADHHYFARWHCG